jgi:transposase-like protein
VARPHNLQTRYTPEQVDKALLALIVTGSVKEASEQTGINTSTLSLWRRQQHADRYAELAEEHAPAARRKIAAELDSLVQAKIEMSWRLIERFDPSKIYERDIPKALAELSRSKATDIDKGLLLRGQPTAIVQKQDATELLEAIARTAPGAIVEGSAEEIPEAEAG